VRLEKRFAGIPAGALLFVGSPQLIDAGHGLDSVTPFWRAIEPGSTLAAKLRIDSNWIAEQRERER